MIGRDSWRWAVGEKRIMWTSQRRESLCAAHYGGWRSFLSEIHENQFTLYPKGTSILFLCPVFLHSTSLNPPRSVQSQQASLVHPNSCQVAGGVYASVQVSEAFHFLTANGQGLWHQYKSFFFKWTGCKCAASSYKLIRQKIVVIPYKQLDRLYRCQTTNFQIPLCMLTQQHRHHTIGGETQKAHTGQRTQRQCTGFLNIERQHTQLTYEDMLRSSPTLSCITDPKVTQWAHLQIVDLTVIHLICNLTEYSQQRDSSLDTRIMTALVACSKT